MQRTDRRAFLGTSAAVAGAMMWGAAESQAEELQTLRIGVIGVGWYGMVDAKAALKVGQAEITAICDVDREHLEKSAAELETLQGKRPRTFHRYEDLLDLPEVDAVIIATPPQWHALQLIAALEQGKDVYCEKPVSYDVREGQAMVAAVEQSDRIVQVGFQRRQSVALREAVELIQAGGIGDLVQVDAQIHYRAGLKDATPQAPPETLDWDLWCGPGPLIPYSPQVGHHSWRLEKTSGHGHLVDWGIHWIDAIRALLNLGMPRQVTAAGGIYQYQGRITTPDTLSVHFEFDRVPVHWRHRLWGSTEFDPELNNGIFFFGTEGTIFATDQEWIVARGGRDPEKRAAPADLGALHMADFLDAVRQRRAPSCVIRSAFESTASVQLAMIAYDTQRTVCWDAQTSQLTDPVAAALLQREYRSPWQHPYRG